MPAAIIASTEDCDIVSVDSQTGVVTVLADFKSYRPLATDFSGCSDQGLEYRPYTGTAEIAPGFIEDVEWAAPKYVLIGNCCEPAVGRFTVLDIENHDQPYWLSRAGSYPSISHSGVLMFSDGGFNVRTEIASLGIAQFEVSYQESDQHQPTYRLDGVVTHHNLALDDAGDGAEHRTSYVYRTTWVGDNAVAVGIHTSWEGSGWIRWVALVDLDSGPVAANSRGAGWMHPTGDQLGNLVVAEQYCLYYLSECMGSPSKVVVVDSETLIPLHETNVEEIVVDMDLERGWLLVTLADGRLGTLDLTSGTFTHLADGIRNAVWQE